MFFDFKEIEMFKYVLWKWNVYDIIIGSWDFIFSYVVNDIY